MLLKDDHSILPHFEQKLNQKIFLIDDPYEETNLATNSDYASILADLESKVDVFADGIYTFETSGTCLESEVLDADNNWITGCCNYV